MNCYRDNNFKFEIFKTDKWNKKLANYPFIPDTSPITSLGRVVEHPPIVYLGRPQRQTFNPQEGYMLENMYRFGYPNMFEVHPSPPTTLVINNSQKQKFKSLYNERNEITRMAKPCFYKPHIRSVFQDASILGTPKDANVENYLKTLPNYLSRDLWCGQGEIAPTHTNTKVKGNANKLHKDKLSRRVSQFPYTLQVMPCDLRRW